MFTLTIELTQREKQNEKDKNEIAALTRRLLAVKEKEVDALNRANEQDVAV